MIAQYISSADCSACLDLGWDDVDCVECTKARTHKVEVLQLGGGLFGNKAVVKDLKTNALTTVNISDLKEI